MMPRLRGAARTLAMITSWADVSPVARVVFGAFQERTKLLRALPRVSRQGSPGARHGNTTRGRRLRPLLACDHAGDAEAQPGAARGLRARPRADAADPRAARGQRLHCVRRGARGGG